jgi:competence protein ComEC
MGLPLAEKWIAAWRPFSVLPKPNWRWYHRRIDWCGRWLLGSAAVCWTAFLASAPAGIGFFHVLSPGSLLANLVIIPLSSLAMVAGFLSLLTGLTGLGALSVLFNSAAAVTLIIMDWLVQHGTALPGVYFPAQFARGWLAPAVLAGMAALMLAGLSGRWSRRYGGFWPPVAALGLILILIVKFG